MTSLIASLLWMCSTGASLDNNGLLYQPEFRHDEYVTGPPRRYFPQTGDIFLSTDHLKIVIAGHALAGAGPIHHSGLILVRPDGKTYTLEAAPHNTLTVKILPLQVNLTGYEEEGNKVWIRRRMAPLTPAQEKRFIDFADAQNGKPFAVARVFAQMTPIRHRGTIRTDFMGKPNGERAAYYCAELALETLLAAGLLDPAKTRPSATYPVDLFYGRSDIPFIDTNLAINAGWEPPARWFSKPLPGEPRPFLPR